MTTGNQGMHVHIRQAGIDDAPAIALVKRLTWQDDTADDVLIATALSQANRVTHVALMDEAVVGFVDGFITRAASGERRWEVDMLAVAPPYRGQGVASRLIARSTTAGEQNGAVLARGLVKVGNHPSERAFAACGYCCTPPSRLYVSDGTTESAGSNAAGLHLVYVRTFAYTGGWIEGVFSLANLRAASALREVYGWGIVGAVIPDADESASCAADEAGFTCVGEYRWWQRALTSGAGQGRRSGHRFCES